MKVHGRSGAVLREYDPVKVDAQPVAADGKNLTYSYLETRTVAEGLCGQQCSWELVTSDEDASMYTLQIRGAGDMYDYRPDRDDPSPFEKWKDRISLLIIGNGVEGIGTYAFAGLVCLRKAILSETVKKIGDFAFCNDESLEGIINTLQLCQIGWAAFAYCSSLMSMPLSADCKIEKNTFLRCRNLADQNGFIVENSILYGYRGTDEEIYIPSWVKVIGDSAFYANETVRVVHGHSEIVRIERYAFSNSEIERIEGFDGVKTIEMGAFASCLRYEEARFKSAEKVDFVAFFGCQSLKIIALPASAEIAEDAFFDCPAVLCDYMDGASDMHREGMGDA